MIVLNVAGTPAPQGSKSAFVPKGWNRAVVVEGGSTTGRAKHKAWREAVAEEARAYQQKHNIPVLDAPLKVTMHFSLQKPKSKPKWKIYPDVKPDLDKLQRSVLDSLTGTLIRDDSIVCQILATKEYALDGPPGVVIVIDELPERV